MGSRLWVAASSHRITGSTLTWATNHTQMGIATVASLPGAGVRRTLVSVQSATAARDCALQLDGDNAGSLACLVGATRILPSSNMVPTADGRWYFFATSKAAGTVTVRFLMYDFLTGTWTILSSSGTVGNRTASGAQLNIGAHGAANYWDGLIAAVAHVPRIVQDSAIQRAIQGKATMRGMMGNADISQNLDVALAGFFFDLTPNNSRIWSESTRLAQAIAGTPGAYDAVSTPPGW